MFSLSKGNQICRKEFWLFGLKVPNYSAEESLKFCQLLGQFLRRHTKSADFSSCGQKSFYESRMEKQHVLLLLLLLLLLATGCKYSLPDNLDFSCFYCELQKCQKVYQNLYSLVIEFWYLSYLITDCLIYAMAMGDSVTFSVTLFFVCFIQVISDNAWWLWRLELQVNKKTFSCHFPCLVARPPQFCDQFKLRFLRHCLPELESVQPSICHMLSRDEPVIKSNWAELPETADGQKSMSPNSTLRFCNWVNFKGILVTFFIWIEAKWPLVGGKWTLFLGDQRFFPGWNILRTT